MTKIVSRVKPQDVNIKKLQQILEAASMGAIGDTSSGSLFELSDNMDELIEQTDDLFEGMMDAMEEYAARIISAQNEALHMAIEIDMLQDRLAALIGGIDYDDALDQATRDLMECFCASGSADVSSDGELVFDERISFTKEDIKPMLREAIVRWVEMKLGE